MSDVFEITKAGWIYLLYTSNTYKIGNTENLFLRMGQYPADSIILHHKFANGNLNKIENDLKKIFRIQFTPREDLGKEYFDGNSNSMISIIDLYFKDHVLNESQDHESVTQQETIKVTKEKIPKIVKVKTVYVAEDPAIIVSKYINENLTKYSGTVITCSQFYKDFKAWNITNKFKLMNFLAVSKHLKRQYKVIFETKTFDTQFEQVFIFPNLLPKETKDTDEEIIINFIENHCISTNNNSDMTPTKDIYNASFVKSSIFNGRNQAWFSLNLSKYTRFVSAKIKTAQFRDIPFVKGLKLKN